MDAAGAMSRPFSELLDRMSPGARARVDEAVARELARIYAHMEAATPLDPDAAKVLAENRSELYL